MLIDQYGSCSAMHRRAVETVPDRALKVHENTNMALRLRHLYEIRGVKNKEDHFLIRNLHIMSSPLGLL